MFKLFIIDNQTETVMTIDEFVGDNVNTKTAIEVYDEFRNVDAFSSFHHVEDQDGNDATNEWLEEMGQELENELPAFFGLICSPIQTLQKKRVA